MFIDSKEKDRVCATYAYTYVIGGTNITVHCSKMASCSMDLDQQYGCLHSVEWIGGME